MPLSSAIPLAFLSLNKLSQLDDYLSQPMICYVDMAKDDRGVWHKLPRQEHRFADAGESGKDVNRNCT